MPGRLFPIVVIVSRETPDGMMDEEVMQNTTVWERSLYWLALIYSLEKQFR